MSSVRGVHVPGSSSSQQKAISYGPQSTSTKTTKVVKSPTKTSAPKSGRKGKS